jgi:ribosomal protein S18 acetylase RimI-like enzyme
MAAIRHATVKDLDVLVPLFDSYRQFYGCASDPHGAREFLRVRLDNQESVIFLAFTGTVAVDLTQLYPSFSSAAMRRIFVLNDLYVDRAARRSGVGCVLLAAASGGWAQYGAVRLTLSTELTNTSTLALYEASGWKQDTVFCAYQLTL